MLHLFRKNKTAPLKSAAGKKIKMPFSDMALNLEYKGISVTDDDHFYWCVSPIYDEMNRVHLFCSRKEFSWFYSDTYESKPLMNAQEIITNHRILERTNNVIVINLPPDKNGKLVDGDVENLMYVAKELGITRI